MKRRLAIWMYQRALKMEPLIAIGIQQAANELAEARMAQIVQQHQANVTQIARSN